VPHLLLNHEKREEYSTSFTENLRKKSNSKRFTEKNL
jgi:hypothetical protein